jgi:hypothetical protein
MHASCGGRNDEELADLVDDSRTIEDTVSVS